jgi:hypothetical protein
MRLQIQSPNGKEKDLYALKLSEKKAGIISHEPVTCNHWRQAATIKKWSKVAAMVVIPASRPRRSIPCPHPVKKIFYKFPGGIKEKTIFQLRGGRTPAGNGFRTRQVPIGSSRWPTCKHEEGPGCKRSSRCPSPVRQLRTRILLGHGNCGCQAKHHGRCQELRPK